MLSRSLRFALSANARRLSAGPKLLSSRPPKPSSSFLDNKPPSASSLSQEEVDAKRKFVQDSVAQGQEIYGDGSVNDLSQRTNLASVGEKPDAKVRLRSLPLLKYALQTKEDRALMEAWKAKKHADWQKADAMDIDERERVLQESTDDAIKNSLNRGMLFCVALAAVGFGYYLYIFGVSTITSYDSSYNPVSIYNRAAYYSFEYFKEEYTTSKQNVVLPPLQEVRRGYQDINPKLHIVIEPLHLLVTTEYDLTHHFRFKKRKGATRLLEQLMQPLDRPVNDLRAECVLWTVGSDFDNQSWLPSLAENGRATPLFRSSCDFRISADCYMDVIKNMGLQGAYVKNLNRLGRNMKKVILFDSDPKQVAANPRNCLLLKKPQEVSEDEMDTTLYDLSMFINSLVENGVEDVRPIVEHYNQYGVGWMEEFKKNRQKQLLDEEEAATRRSAQKPSSRWFKKSFH